MFPGITPKGVLVDYGGTLVEEGGFDPRAGNEVLLARASFRPSHVGLEQVLARATTISAEVADRRDEFHIETPWPTLTRLIHDFLGIRLRIRCGMENGVVESLVKTVPMNGLEKR